MSAAAVSPSPRLKILVIGAHPDDCDLKARGVTALYTHDLGGGLGLQAALNMRHQSTSHADLEGNPLYTLPNQDLMSASMAQHTGPTPSSSTISQSSTDSRLISRKG